MKAKLKPHKLLSMLLALVMVVGMLPTTAFAAGNPDPTAVFVDGGKSFYNNRLYYKKGDQDKNFTGNEGDYIAHYNPATGTLTLNGYSGGSISVGGVKCSDITVVLKGTNTINGSLENAVGGDITVTSSDGGTLSISKTTSGSNSAIGIETGLSASYTTGNVTIKGNAKVTINMTHNGTSTYEKAYGIFAKENITISENASVDITCATPNNTTGGGNCNGLYAAKDVTIDTNGTIKIDVTNAGRDKDNGYSYGVYHMRTATLTKVGNMEVQWKKEGNSTRYSGGAFTKGATFSDTDHAINEDTTNCYASYRFGTPRTVMVENGTLTGPGVKYPNGNGKFLVGDTVNIKPNEKKSSDGTLIPFKEWTSEGVALASPTTPNTSFNVPTNDVTVTATYNPFDGAPVFTRTSDSSGTIKFKTVANPDNSEFFEYVKDGETAYNRPYSQPTTTSSASPYEYSVSVSTYYAGDIKNLEAGDYRMAVTLNGERYLSEKFTVNYTAAPTGNYPDHVRVYNGSGTFTSLSNGECLATNADTSATPYTSGDYVARYDQSNGTLYLNGYQNDHQIIAPDSVIFANGDLNIEVVSDSSFSTSVSATSDLHGIRANGTLNISGSGKLTVTANGNGTVYGIYADKGVKISAPLDVRVGKVDSSTNGSLYGIYTKSGAISLSGNDMTVTATDAKETVYGVYNAADTSTAITENGNITISGNLTVNLSKGNNRGISSQGGVITLEGATVKIPGSYRYGIFNRNGNVVIKSKSDVDISSDISDNNGICTYSGGDLTIENSAVKVSAHGYAANLEYGKLLIENSDVELTKTNGLVACVVNTHINAVNKIDLSGSGTVTLTAPGEQTSAMIGGTVTATSGTKLEKGTYYPDLKTYDGEYDGSSKTVLQFVHEDPAPTTYTVSFDANGGTGTMADVTGVSGEYTLPANGFTAPDGKQFKAWSVGGVEKAAGDKITVTANTTVTAVWEAIEYNVTVTGGTASVGAGTPITKATMGTTVTLTAGAAPSGQMFDKWVVNGVVVDDANSATTTFVMPAGNVTAEATYKNIPVVTYTVTFNANGGTGSMADATGVSGDYVLPVCGFTAPNGKQFKAWSVGGVEKAVGDKITVTANTTVTAVWEDIPVVTYTVSFAANGGTGTMADVTGISGEYTLPANGFTAPDGKQFKAWSVGGVEKAAGDTITVNANTTVTAIWENIPVTYYTVTFDSNGGSAVTAQSIEAGQKATKPADPTKDGYDFKGWTLNGSAYDFNTAVNGNITLVATWEQQQVVLSFDANGGTGSMAAATGVSGDYVLPVCTFTAPTGKQFKAWSVDGVEKAAGDKITVTADTTVTAIWENIPAGPAGPAGHTHSYGSEWKTDADKHWHECSCGAKAEEAAHTASGWITDTPATATTDGTKHKECTECGYVMETAKISHIAGVKPGAVKYTYSGSVKTPSVKVTDADGNVLVKDTDYSVAYPAGRKAVGKYTVKIVFKGNYEGTKSFSFTIKPKTAKIKSLTATSRKLTVKAATKVSATGGTVYQIAYKQKGTSTWKYTTTTSYYKTIKSLKKGKQYYVKMRAYRKLGTTKYYGSWSTVKLSKAVK